MVVEVIVLETDVEVVAVAAEEMIMVDEAIMVEIEVIETDRDILCQASLCFGNLCPPKFS